MECYLTVECPSMSMVYMHKCVSLNVLDHDDDDDADDDDNDDNEDVCTNERVNFRINFNRIKIFLNAINDDADDIDDDDDDTVNDDTDHVREQERNSQFKTLLIVIKSKEFLDPHLGVQRNWYFDSWW